MTLKNLSNKIWPNISKTSGQGTHNLRLNAALTLYRAHGKWKRYDKCWCATCCCFGIGHIVLNILECIILYYIALYVIFIVKGAIFLLIWSFFQIREQGDHYQTISTASKGVSGRSDLVHYVKGLNPDKSAPPLRLHTFTSPALLNESSTPGMVNYCLPFDYSTEIFSFQYTATRKHAECIHTVKRNHRRQGLPYVCSW